MQLTLLRPFPYCLVSHHCTHLAPEGRLACGGTGVALWWVVPHSECQLYFVCQQPPKLAAVALPLVVVLTCVPRSKAHSACYVPFDLCVIGTLLECCSTHFDFLRGFVATLLYSFSFVPSSQVHLSLFLLLHGTLSASIWDSLWQRDVPGYQPLPPVCKEHETLSTPLRCCDTAMLLLLMLLPVLLPILPRWPTGDTVSNHPEGGGAGIPSVLYTGVCTVRAHAQLDVAAHAGKRHDTNAVGPGSRH